MLLILKALEDEVALLIFKFFNPIISSHIVKLAYFVGHGELLGAVVHAGILGMEHVCTQVQDRSLVDVEVFIVWKLASFGWAFEFLLRHFAIVLDEMAYLFAEVAFV